MSGALLKLTIIPFKDSEQMMGPPAGPPFIAQFNPETYTDTTEVNLGPQEQAKGADGSEAKFEAIQPKKYSFELMLDGTGVAPGLPVIAAVELFKVTVGLRGDMHRPPFLMLVWGSLVAFTVLESCSVSYKLFSPAGLPLRASLSVTFREHVPKQLGALKANLASPDIEHAHEVREGEHLTTIVNEVYGDPAYYLAVARANGLDTVRQLQPGSALYLPPVS